MIKFIMPISDDYLFTLKTSSYLFDKFWPDNIQIDVLGFKNPEFNISNKMNFVSLDSSQKGGVYSWSRYICDYLKTIREEEIIFILEDFFPISSPNLKLLENAFAVFRSNNVGRFDISIDTSINRNFGPFMNYENYQIVKTRKNAMYRISTQPAIWKKKYLIKILEQTTTPWSFEIDGSKISKNYTEDVLAFHDEKWKNYPTRWIHHGAVSRRHPNKVNILGLDFKTIEELIEKKLVLKEQMIWGAWKGSPPSFKQLNEYNFHPKLLQKFKIHSTEWKEYYSIYDKELK